MGLFKQLSLFELKFFRKKSLPTPKFPQFRKNPSSRTKSRRKLYNDECPTLKRIWTELHGEYFPDEGHLAAYTVYWSRRKQLRTLASCNIDQRRIIVAQELNAPEHYRWLSPLLFHEMCHAALEYNVPKINGRSQWHGEKFRSLEELHPLMSEFDKWIDNGGWARAVRSHRAKAAHQRRKEKLSA